MRTGAGSDKPIARGRSVSPFHAQDKPQDRLDGSSGAWVAQFHVRTNQHEFTALERASCADVVLRRQAARLKACVIPSLIGSAVSFATFWASDVSFFDCSVRTSSCSRTWAVVNSINSDNDFAAISFVA
jgi:hypothetical protein